jgi:hypothetical protein
MRVLHRLVIQTVTPKGVEQILVLLQNAWSGR